MNQKTTTKKNQFPNDKQTFSKLEPKDTRLISNK